MKKKKKKTPCWESKWNHMFLKQFERELQTQRADSKCMSSRVSTGCLAHRHSPRTRLQERLDPLKSYHPSGEHMHLLSSPQALAGCGKAPLLSCTHTPRIPLHFFFFNAALPTLLLRTLSPLFFLSLLSLKISTQAFMVGRVCC